MSARSSRFAIPALILAWTLGTLILTAPAAPTVPAKAAEPVGTTSGTSVADKPADVSGSWLLRLDPADKGLAERWFEKPLPYKLTKIMQLPGSLAERKLGEDITVDTAWTGGIVDKSWFSAPEYAPYRMPGAVKVPFWLNPIKHYVGPAWYQKDVAFPKSWKGRRVVLSLERCHWETRLWIDGAEVGTNDSLSTPHEYDLTRFAKPGSHRLLIRIDNRIRDIAVGENAHSVSDHTQTNWNGIVGNMALTAGSMLYIDAVRVDPDVPGRKAKVTVQIVNDTGRPHTGNIVLLASRVDTPGAGSAAPLYIRFTAAEGRSETSVDYPLGSDAVLWDEFSPGVYALNVSLRGLTPEVRDDRTVRFGLRDFKAQGTRFTVNGRPVFLRGTVECCVFPKTGYPPMMGDEWRRIFLTAKAHGLNHIRFHSWCPPEAAFAAADEAGLYLYVECPLWAEIGEGKPVDAWLYKESERIIKAYGNHPSFCLMSAGNEPAGKSQARFLGDFVNSWRNKDRRRAYTSGAGWPSIPENDFHVLAEPRIQRWGEGLNSIINRRAPQAEFDFRDITAKFDKPVIGHEVGQWCAYPNFAEIEKYTGVLKAKNFEIFRDTLAASGLGALAGDFLSSSGKLQALCYKADIEAALRTPGFAGFELLGLTDFPGQGTAPVGVLDAFWEEKGYISPLEFRRFCGPVVPLARMPKMVYLQSEELIVPVEAANFGPAPLMKVVPEWALMTAKDEFLQRGRLPERDVPWGNDLSLGVIKIPLAGLAAPARYRLTVRLADSENGWDFWVYPAALPAAPPASDLLVARRLDAAAVERLKAGGKVLLVLEKGAVKPEKGGSVALGFSSIFWNTAWTSKQPPHTLGLLCDPAHPALAEFPTEACSNWQWWDAITHGQAVRLDDLGKGFTPIVRIIDDWFSNRSLALVFEVRSGGGKLLVCASDLIDGAENRPEARQLLRSLSAYAAGPKFDPKTAVDLEAIKGLFK
ncbi:MAG: beta-galactosidase [Acidobacteriota bacterium]|nr:beta-galactosidase [Acidobacteriota bacterium]